MKSVSIVIVNYNVTNEVEACLDSIYLHLRLLPIEVIVVDNDSPDQSIKKLTSRFTQTKFVFLDENFGYSKANNLAVDKCNSDYLLILNPDTVLIEDFVSPIIEFIESHENIGCCAPMLVYENLEFQYSTGSKMGFFYEAAEALFYISMFRGLKKALSFRKYREKKPFHVDWMSGACMLMKRDIFNEVNGFNARYFLNYEDLDFCNKVEGMGYSNFYFPHLKCIHLDQKSQNRNYESFVISRYKSRMIYGNDHYGSAKRFWIRLVHIVGLLLRIAFVNLLYVNKEKVERREGYKQSLKLYMSVGSFKSK